MLPAYGLKGLICQQGLFMPWNEMISMMDISAIWLKWAKFHKNRQFQQYGLFRGLKSGHFVQIPYEKRTVSKIEREREKLLTWFFRWWISNLFTLSSNEVQIHQEPPSSCIVRLQTMTVSTISMKWHKWMTSVTYLNVIFGLEKEVTSHHGMYSSPQQERASLTTSTKSETGCYVN